MKTHRARFSARHPRTTVLAAWLAVLIGSAIAWIGLITGLIQIIRWLPL